MEIREKEKKPRIKYRQRMLKNNQSDLEVTMICLLSTFCGIEFTKPQKNVKVTKEFLKIKNLIFPNETFSVKDYKKERFEQIRNEMKNHNNFLLVHHASIRLAYF